MAWVSTNIREWDRQAEKAGLHFLEHISWIKRMILPSKRISRGHEECYIYAISKSRNFYKTKGRYEDVRLPGILFDTYTIDTFQRHVGFLYQWIETGNQPISITDKKCHKVYKRFQHRREGGKRNVNFTNVWSFLPESRRHYNNGNKFHPTTKPLLFQMRLIEMLTPENGSVLDCFSGSGTTAIACKRLNRQFLCIEKEQDFYEHSLERLQGDVWQPELDMNWN